MHQQAWYWLPKPEYYVSSIRRVKYSVPDDSSSPCFACRLSVNWWSYLRVCSVWTMLATSHVLTLPPDPRQKSISWSSRNGVKSDIVHGSTAERTKALWECGKKWFLDKGFSENLLSQMYRQWICGGLVINPQIECSVGWKYDLYSMKDYERVVIRSEIITCIYFCLIGLHERGNSSELTHCGLVMPYDVGDLGQHWFR